MCQRSDGGDAVGSKRCNQSALEILGLLKQRDRMVNILKVAIRQFRSISNEMPRRMCLEPISHNLMI